MAEGAKFTNPAVHGLALSEATVWRLMNKDFAGAKKTADLAAQLDNHPSAIGTVSGLLVSGNEPPEDWRKKVEAAPLTPVMKQPILAYGFFLNGHYNEAVAEWRKVLDASEGSDLRAAPCWLPLWTAPGKARKRRRSKLSRFSCASLPIFMVRSCFWKCGV